MQFLILKLNMNRKKEKKHYINLILNILIENVWKSLELQNSTIRNTNR